ncbi:MAG TPA: hypothetical protein VL282_08120, partial [Tepidisphaeraceae bacterium]|nr:hypothetical protein [Tepidisphaeraceae bacterium]
MSRLNLSAVVLIAAILLVPSITFAAASDDVALRIRFGMKDKAATKWDGKLVLSEGKVTSMRGWRWAPGDSADESGWTVSTRRQPAQGSAEKARIAAGGKMPMGDNGFTVQLSGTKPDTSITFDSEAGKHEFKLSDVPYGKTLSALDGNLQIERVPAPAELAVTTEDEDYPSIAAGKDGTLYAAYVSFAHGKDFQGARERPVTKESGPVSGPNMQGAIRHLDKPEDFDYLAEPAGGEQVFLRVGKKDGSWSEPIAVTDGKEEVYRTALAVDGSGRVWVFYSAHQGADENLDHGNWELMARPFDANGKSTGAAVNVSNAAGNDFMPAATTDSTGKVWVAWVGGREKSFNIFSSHQEGEQFAKPQRVTDQAANEWEP